MSHVIALTNAIANTERVYVTSDCTVFFNERPIHGTWETLNAAYKALRAQLKRNNVRVVNKYKTASRIKALKEPLTAALEVYHTQYTALAAGVAGLIDVGITSPTVDNLTLQALYRRATALQTMQFHSSSIGQYLEIMRTLDQLKEANLGENCTAYL